MQPIIAIPKGALVPDSIDVPLIVDGTFIEKLVENNNHPIAIVQLSTEELIALVEKPHLFGVDVIALVGAPGGRYDAVWSEYIAPLRRVSVDTLAAEIQQIMAAHSAEGQKTREASLRPRVPALEEDAKLRESEELKGRLPTATSDEEVFE